MPSFRYKARNRQGTAVSGAMEADDPVAVADRLFEAGYTPISIERRRLEQDFWKRLPRFSRVKAEDLIFFTRQLATLLKVGIPILEAFDTLARQTGNRRLRRVLLDISREVEAGSSLSEAFGKHAEAFSEVYVNTIRAGEAGGFLDLALERLATLAEHEAQTKAKIKAATRYPIFVVTAIAVAFSIIILFVVPKFALLYGAFKATLPLPTRVAIALNRVVQAYWPFAIGGIVAIVVAFRFSLRIPAGRLRWDTLKLRFPIIGPLVTKLTMSRFAHILGILTRSGIAILKSLELTARAVGNVAVAHAIEGVYQEVEKGRSLAEPMARDPFFPPLLVQMVAVGEKTGELDGLLQRISEHYDMEADYTIKNLATALEPILLLVVGAMVFFLALAVFLPMWDMVKLVRR
ncbi:MAG: type II secretion system F family protein [candidate division NC10 bacterium]|nr:type II secretion system F family protein [candidate division NC10 bacterium]